jgi:hypothetical protein
MNDNSIEERISLDWCDCTISVVLSDDPDVNQIAELNDLIRLGSRKIVKTLSE